MDRHWTRWFNKGDPTLKIPLLGHPPHVCGTFAYVLIDHFWSSYIGEEINQNIQSSDVKPFGGEHYPSKAQTPNELASLAVHLVTKAAEGN